MEFSSFIKSCLYLLEEKYQLAFEELKSIVAKSDAPKEAYILVGSVLRKNGEYRKAIHIHESLVGDKSFDGRLNKILFFELVKDYKESKDYEKSLYYANKLLAIDKSPVVYKYIYKLNLLMKNYDEAFKFLEKYQKITKNNYAKELSYILYEKYMATDKKDESLLKKSLKIYPENRASNMAFYDIVFSSGKKTKIIETFDDLLKREVIKTEKDLKKFENDFFAMGLFKEFESAIFRKVAQMTSNPVYTVYCASMFKKKNNSEKAREILVRYLSDIGEKRIVKNRLLDILLPEELKMKFKSSDIYVCAGCNNYFGEYSEYCPVCGQIETLDFA
jgi:lipopolysaccharide biosynthesis regulator YciM